MRTFEHLESEVRSYCRSFPTVFTTARGSTLTDRRGREFLDFFSGAGALNYGHNPPELKSELLRYIRSDGITHSLDMATEAKERFLRSFEEIVLRPRGLDYKAMFPGPTGTNAVEAALKLARKVTGRTDVIAFTNAFHGMTLGSLAVTGNEQKRAAAGVPLPNVVRMPYDGYLGPDIDSLEVVEQLLADSSSGVDGPAAFIVETVQAEGGVNVASARWLRRLAALAREVGALLVVDDIQVGCGRTGTFFSFEPAGIQPDLVCLSKSLSGYGLPFSMVLIDRPLDQWEAGEHNGTFRGNNLAFVTARATLEQYWRSSDLSDAVSIRGEKVRERLELLAREHAAEPRGRGLLQGLAFDDGAVASRIASEAFELGLLVETSGAEGEVVKVMPPLTIDAEDLECGLDLLEKSVRSVRGEPDGPADDLDPCEEEVKV